MKGFTLIELLVVTAIVALLATIILVSLTSARERGQSSRILQDFQQLERAVLFFADDEGIIVWWEDTSFGLGANPTIRDLIINTNLSTFLSREPSPSVGDDYRYNTVNGDYTCGGPDLTLGVNLTLSNVPLSHFEIIDENIDGGDGASCGKINYDGVTETIYYKLGTSRSSY